MSINRADSNWPESEVIEIAASPFVSVAAWPNQLGYDVQHRGTDCEVWQHKDHFRVFTEYRVGLVSFETTTEPAMAAELVKLFGHERERLDDMPFREAEQLFTTQYIS